MLGPELNAILFMFGCLFLNKPIPPPAIKPKILEQLIHTCTTKVLFYDPLGKLYIDGFPLGPII